MLLHKGTESKKRIRKDYDRTGLRIPPVEKLKYKCRSFRYATTFVWNRLKRNVREIVFIDTFETRLKKFCSKKLLAD